MAAAAATILSIAVIGALVLIGFGLRFAFVAEHRKHGVLMTIAGLVILANVLIWTL